MKKMYTYLGTNRAEDKWVHGGDIEMKNGEVKSLKAGDHFGEKSRAFMREDSKICMGFN